jgi:ankyrin repeat protein
MTMPLNYSFSSLITDMIKSNVTIQALNLEHTNIGYKDEKGRNALYFSIETKNISNTKLLIENGIPLMVAPNKHALFHAVYCDDIEGVKLLIEKGIDVNIRDYGYKTPLMCAVYYNRLKIFNFLINHGADIFSMDIKYDMAIDYAHRVDAKQIRDILHWRMMHDEQKMSN